MVSSLLQNFAATGPKMDLSPESRKKTCLGGVGELPEPSPNSKSKRKEALDEPTKKGLKAYERLMVSHEGAVKKAIAELDKATEQFMQNHEMKAEQKKRNDARLQRKKERNEEVAAESRRTV